MNGGQLLRRKMRHCNIKLRNNLLSAENFTLSFSKVFKNTLRTHPRGFVILDLNFRHLAMIVILQRIILSHTIGKFHTITTSRVHELSQLIGYETTGRVKNLNAER